MNSVSVSTREFVEETEGRRTCLTLVSSTLTLSFPTSSPQGVTMKQSRDVMGEHHSSDVKGSVSMSTTACQIWKYNKSVFGHLLCERAHTHMHTHTCIPVHIFLCVQVCVCVCVCVYTYGGRCQLPVLLLRNPPPFVWDRQVSYWSWSSLIQADQISNATEPQGSSRLRLSSAEIIGTGHHVKGCILFLMWVLGVRFRSSWAPSAQAWA